MDEYSPALHLVKYQLCLEVEFLNEGVLGFRTEGKYRRSNNRMQMYAPTVLKAECQWAELADNATVLQQHTVLQSGPDFQSIAL